MSATEFSAAHLRRQGVAVNTRQCDLSVSPSSVSVQRGSTNTVTATVLRVNYNGLVTITVSGLPANVTATSATLNKNQSEATITISATADATLQTNTPLTFTSTSALGIQTVSVALTITAVPPPDPNVPEWDILRDFDSGTVNTSAVGPDAFTGSAGRSVYTTEQVYAGPQAVKMVHLAGNETAFHFGGVINFPNKLVKGDTLWLQLYIYLPSDFVINTDAGQLKFLRIRTYKASGANDGYLDVYLRDDGSGDGTFRTIKENKGSPWVLSGPLTGFPKGAWRRISLMTKYDEVIVNNGGTGRTKLWMDGVLMADMTNVPPITQATAYSTAFFLFTYWNPPGPSKVETAYADSIRIAKNGIPTWVQDLPGVL